MSVWRKVRCLSKTKFCHVPCSTAASCAHVLLLSGQAPIDEFNRGMLLSLLGPRGDRVKLESFRAEIFDTVTLPAYDYERALRFWI